jgi:uncharacterized protein (DUF697 family)
MTLPCVPCSLIGGAIQNSGVTPFTFKFNILLLNTIDKGKLINKQTLLPQSITSVMRNGAYAREKFVIDDSGP